MRRVHSLKYLYLRNKTAGTIEHSAHLLVVKNKKYAHLAKICAESFIFNNPKSKITIHCDEETYQQVNNQLKVLISRQKAQVILDQTFQDKSWQEQKLNLILSLCGTEEIFMDADLKWNGQLDFLSGLTFFYEEFALNKSNFFLTVLKDVFPEIENFGSMKNTSFFTWKSFALTESQRADVINYNKTLTEYAQKHGIKNEKFAELERISEQLVLSVLAECWKVRVEFLKDSDDIFDGQFVESSYFGATGGEF